MTRMNRITLAAASAAALFLAAESAPAQRLASIGSGSYESPSNPGQISYFSHIVVAGPNNTAYGHAVWVFPNVVIAVVSA